MEAEFNTSVQKKKYGQMALQFAERILVILIFFFIVLTALTVSRVKKSSQEDYSASSQKIIEEDAGRIGYWNQVLVNDLRIYSDNDITKTGNTSEIIAWLEHH